MASISGQTKVSPAKRAALGGSMSGQRVVSRNTHGSTGRSTRMATDQGACDQCYRLKVKCERDEPTGKCNRCAEHNVPCTRSLGRRPPGKPKGSKNKPKIRLGDVVQKVATITEDNEVSVASNFSSPSEDIKITQELKASYEVNGVIPSIALTTDQYQPYTNGTSPPQFEIWNTQMPWSDSWPAPTLCTESYPLSSSNLTWLDSINGPLTSTIPSSYSSQNISYTPSPLMSTPQQKNNKSTTGTTIGKNNTVYYPVSSSSAIAQHTQWTGTLPAFSQSPNATSQSSVSFFDQMSISLNPSSCNGTCLSCSASAFTIFSKLNPILGILVDTTLDVALSLARHAHIIVRISLHCRKFQEYLTTGATMLSIPNIALNMCLLLIDALRTSYRVLGTEGPQTAGLYPADLIQYPLLEEQTKLVLDRLVRQENEKVEQSFLALEQCVKNSYPQDQAKIKRIEASKRRMNVI